jgi:hypothetical protein
MRTLVGGETPADAIYLAELDYHAEAVEQEIDERPQTPPSAAPKAPPKRKARRPRRDPRLKGTKELPGLFDPDGSGGKTTSKDDSQSSR